MAGKLSPYPKDKFLKALKSKGFEESRIKGGHAVYERTTTQSVTVPIHDKEINGGIVKRLDKEFGLGIFK